MCVVPSSQAPSVFESFKKFKAKVEMESGGKIIAIKSDRGGEFTSREFMGTVSFMGFDVY
ncbi:hypothetical protein V2J09_015980 [Rumex salicifolius]